MFGLTPPQSIFVHADGFLKTAIYLNKQPGEPEFDPHVFAALVTNSAFASELYLKCLIQIETGQLIKDEHNLHALFRKLPRTVQQEVEDLFNAELERRPKYEMNNADAFSQKMIDSIPNTLTQALKIGGKAFVTWRYLYESGDTGHFALFPLPSILRMIILLRKPEWARFRFSLTRIGSALSTSPAQKTPTPIVPADHQDGDNR